MRSRSSRSLCRGRNAVFIRSRFASCCAGAAAACFLHGQGWGAAAAARRRRGGSVTGGRRLKGIILAAGKGARLNGTAGDRPKGPLRVGDSTLVERQIETLRALGVEDVAVVVGCQADLVRQICGRGVEFVE